MGFLWALDLFKMDKNETSPEPIQMRRTYILTLRLQNYWFYENKEISKTAELRIKMKKHQKNE